MILSKRLKAFEQLGEEINALTSSELNEIAALPAYENPWFTPDNVKMALKGIALFLDNSNLQQWTKAYSLEPMQPKTVGVAMAGNIPLVGFHDFLCVLISGNYLRAKLSSQDSVLMKFLGQKLLTIEPEFKNALHWDERLNGVDAMIATGGNNTARYFEYYFRNIPHIIRKNRSSCAVLSGLETADDLDALGQDVFTYFGLGCRNISKLYLPEGYDFNALMARWEKFMLLTHHHKYFNNYEYQKSILLINKIPFYDNGVILLKEDVTFVSPISVLFYEFYKSPEELRVRLQADLEKIQCVVSSLHWLKEAITFGSAQFPAVSDYADGVDTLAFLSNL